jgi:hypothetical protein
MLRPLVLAAVLAGCQTLLPEFSAEAFRNATSLKVDTLAMVDRAGERFANRRADAEGLRQRLDAAAEFAKGLPNNQLAAQQWEVIRDPQGGSAGGFLRLWQEKGTLPPRYRAEKKAQLARQFDLVICLEANKQAPRGCADAVGEPLPAGPGGAVQ